MKNLSVFFAWNSAHHRNLHLRAPLTYWLGGLSIRSDLPLPGLLPSRSKRASQADVVISRSRVPESLSSVTAEFPEGQCNENELLLNIPDAARYLIRHGAEILVDPAPLASPGDVTAYLLGTAFGVLCHQRGNPPLHASAIEVDDGCVAFTGDSGAGKSTLVAALAARRHQVISDDVCVLYRDDHGHLLIWPGLNRLRLWEDAMQALACERPGVEREFRGFNKYLIPLDPPRNPGKSRRLCRVYQLDSIPNGTQPSVTKLHGAAAVEILMQNIYRSNLAEHMGKQASLFTVCAAVARDVPVYRFSRPLGFDMLPEGLDVLEQHLRDDNARIGQAERSAAQGKLI